MWSWSSCCEKFWCIWAASWASMAFPQALFRSEVGHAHGLGPLCPATAPTPTPWVWVGPKTEPCSASEFLCIWHATSPEPCLGNSKAQLPAAPQSALLSLSQVSLEVGE